MSMMCPLNGCKQKHGMCIHEKMMLVIILLGLVVGAIYLLVK